MSKIIVEEYDVEEGDILNVSTFPNSVQFLRMYGYEFDGAPPLNGDWLEGAKYKDSCGSVKWLGYRARRV